MPQSGVVSPQNASIRNQSDTFAGHLSQTQEIEAHLYNGQENNTKYLILEKGGSFSPMDNTTYRVASGIGTYN